MAPLLLLLAVLIISPLATHSQPGPEPSDFLEPPSITWLSPAKGHVAGGTLLTILGTNFQRSSRIKVRFAAEEDITEVPGTWISGSKVVCETPPRSTVHTAQVTVSNDGSTYSGYPLVYTAGSGTFLKFIYDNSDPGCLDCRQGSAGINPAATRVREIWTVDNSTGPYIGGTLVTITATKLNATGLMLRGGAGGIQTYSGPVGGPGTPHPFSVDPMAPGNGPPITGTFYPGKYLACQWVCSLNLNQDGVTWTSKTSQWMPATWQDYTRVRCESPPMPFPTSPGGDITPSTCTIKVTNNLQQVDPQAGVLFTYQDLPPSVTNIKTAQSSPWPARAPFMGNTEIIVTGTGFLPSKYLACRFGGYINGSTYDLAKDNSHIVGEKGGRARYVSSTQLICVTPTYGPASDATLIPGAVGSGAVLTPVVSGGAVTSVTVVRGGAYYATAPKLNFMGGGGTGARAVATLTGGVVTGVIVTVGGQNYGLGGGATAAVVTSSNGPYMVVSQVTVTAGGSGYLAPPKVVFSGGTFLASSPAKQATASAVLGTGPQAGTVVRVDVVDGGGLYTSPPAVTLQPALPTIEVTANELGTIGPNSPAQVGFYSLQGKGQNELDPAGGPYSADTFVTNPDTSFRYPAGQGSTEERGPLLPPRGAAFRDGSAVKPGHLALVRVSNNYNLGGGDRLNDPLAAPTHVGLRDKVAGTGYWQWSTNGLSPAELDRCRVSVNPPVHQLGKMQGHNLDARLGLGTASDEPDTQGDNSALLYVDGRSVKGGPGRGATAHAVLSDSPDLDLDGLPPGVIKSVVVDASGAGYNLPPTVFFSGGGGGFGGRASVTLSGGTVVAVLLDPYSRGQGYTSAPSVSIMAVDQALQYNAAAPSSNVYLGGGTPYALGNGSAPGTVGHGNWNLDQSARSVMEGPYRGGTNYDLGHGGAFPGYQGNLNLGHPKEDCIYLLYSDVYVAPSGSDATGQGTAGRPYKTIQKCIDAALSNARGYYIYKRADGGDPDAAIPNGTPRFGTESPGERVDATLTGQNTGTPWSQSYTGNQVRVTTGREGQRAYGQNPQGESRGLGYMVNRDRCVLKDGVYGGLGNVNLHPRGHVVQVWAENMWQATIDCGGQPLGMVSLNGSPNEDPDKVAATGSVTMQGVVTRRCGSPRVVQANERLYYVGRPGYGPGARMPNGQYCWPGATGCQAQRPPDGIPSG